MKNIIKYSLIIPLLSICSFIGCDDNIPTIGNREVYVESIELNQDLIDGIILEVGTTKNVAKCINVLPINATDIAQNFYSSNPNIATINGLGIIKAGKAGTTDISIYVGGHEVNFRVTVVDKIFIPATSISLVIDSDLDLLEGASYNLAVQVQFLPEDANDIEYKSNNPDIATISKDGVIKAISEGNATIMVYSSVNNNVKATLNVNVTSFSGDYPQEIRSTWTASASHEIFKTANDDEKNSLDGILDGDYSTNLCLVRPGKSYGSSPKVTVPSGDAIFFIIDMKSQRDVNYFRIRHRNTNQTFVRMYMFDSIEGSNDGENFTTIANNIVVTDASLGEKQESPDIEIPQSNYRYLKFKSQSKECFFQSSFTSQGSSVQFQEVYLGLKK